MKTSRNNKNGFTLIEILIAMAVGLVVMSMIYTFFYLQQKTYINQSEITATQQDIVGAMHLIEREIRMAGYDVTGDAGAGFLQPDVGDSIRFSYDKNEDGATDDPGEVISYGLTSGGILYRIDENGTNTQDTLLENVDAFDIIYLDKNKATTTSAPDIRAVQMTIVVRTGREDYNYTDTRVYENQQGDSIYLTTGSAPNDHFRRRILTAEFLCRNMGLNATGGYGGSVIPVVSSSS